MNIQLTNEINNHIFNFFGLSKTDGKLKTKDLKKFSLAKKLSLELDDGVKYDKEIFGFSGKYNELKISALLSNIAVEKDEYEYILLFQLDNLTIYALKLTPATSNKIYCFHPQSKWVPLSSLLHAKLLVGFEQLDELLITWDKLKEYEMLYKHLINFLNFDANTQ